MTYSELRTQTEQFAAACGAARWRWIDPGEITVSTAFRTSCAMNQCGQFGRCWSCPPAVPSVEKMHEDLLRYDMGLVFQGDYPYVDDFDYEAMEAGALSFYQLCRCLEGHLTELPVRSLVLGAGRCRECRVCTYPNKPCVRAQGPVMSLEAYGVDVTALCRLSDLPYVLENGTVPYTGLALLAV